MYIEVRIKNQTFPTQAGPGYSEVSLNDEKKRVGHLRREIAQTPGILPGRFRLVNRTGADDHQKSNIFAEQNMLNDRPRPGDVRGLRFAYGQFLVQLDWRRQRLLERNVKVGNLV